MNLSAAVRLLRPQQWIKNGFVAAPLFFNPSLWHAGPLADVGLGVLAFCLLSSSIYILNDFFDRDADKRHAIKRHRPLASGAVSLTLATVLFVLLSTGGFLGAALLSPSFIGYALAYYILQIFYCLWLKHAAILDVLTLAMGFVIRVLAGATLLGLEASPWIVIMTLLVALFQGLAVWSQ